MKRQELQLEQPSEYKYVVAMFRPKNEDAYEVPVAQLMDQNQGLTNIEITNHNIKSFERVANRYNIDFALKKDKAADPPRYLVFFKARDLDVMTAAFKEFSAKELVKSKKPSVQKKLAKAQQKAQTQHRQREKAKTKDRGQEL